MASCQGGPVGPKLTGDNFPGGKGSSLFPRPSHDTPIRSCFFGVYGGVGAVVARVGWCHSAFHFEAFFSRSDLIELAWREMNSTAGLRHYIFVFHFVF